MIATSATLSGLKRQRPEWVPWLAVVEEILREAGKATWDAAVPPAPSAREQEVPLLARATVSVPASSVSRLLKQLVRVAVRGGTPKLVTLHGAMRADLDLVKLFTASLWQDSAYVRHTASFTRTDPEALQAVVALLAVPFLHACNRQWSQSVAESWAAGYCPVCGSWPAFAEVRGIERRRYLRCGRCGGEWHAHALSCPYCTTTDHNHLVALVPAGAGGAPGAIDACTRCLGYVKTFTTLQGCAPGGVMLEDLATVALDVAALERGYARPHGSAYTAGARS